MYSITTNLVGRSCKQKDGDIRGEIVLVDVRDDKVDFLVSDASGDLHRLAWFQVIVDGYAELVRPLELD